MPPYDKWTPWRQAWREGGPAVEEPDVLRRRVARERRRMVVASGVELFLTLAAVAGIGLALRHTPRGGDAVWGSVVALLLLVSWALASSRRRDASPPVGAATETYLDLSRRRCRRQLRVVHFAWMLMALELAFLIPWWASGFRYHVSDLGSVIVITTWWLPVGVIAVLLPWTFHVRRRLLAELAHLSRLQLEARQG